MSEIKEIIKELVNFDQLLTNLKTELKEELKKELKAEIINQTANNLLSKKDLAKKYGCSERTITRLVSKGQLAPVSSIGRHMFNEKDFLDLSK